MFLNNLRAQSSMITNIKDVKKCPDCYSEELIYKERDDQVVCKTCGVIFEPLTPKEEEEFEKTRNLTD